MRFLHSHRTLVAALAMLTLLLSACAALLTGNSYWHAAVGTGDADLLTVSNALSPSNLLPRTYFERIKTLPEVDAITEYSSVALFLANERQIYTGVIVDKNQVAQVFPRMNLDAAMLQRWLERKDAILISEKLLESRHLTIGGTVPSRLFYGDSQANQDFYIAGTFGPENELKCSACIFVGRDFADLALPSYRGVVGSYHVRINPGINKEKLRRVIDAMFMQETVATRSTEFLPAASGFLNDLIDLRYLVLLAFWMTLAAAIFLPALCTNLMAQTYRATLALLLALGREKSYLLSRCAGLALVVGALLGFGGYFFAILTGNYIFDDVVWLHIESERAALQGALGVAALITVSCALAGMAVIRRLDVADLFDDTND